MLQYHATPFQWWSRQSTVLWTAIHLDVLILFQTARVQNASRWSSECWLIAKNISSQQVAATFRNRFSRCFIFFLLVKGPLLYILFFSFRLKHFLSHVPLVFCNVPIFTVLNLVIWKIIYIQVNNIREKNSYETIQKVIFTCNYYLLAII